MHYKLLRNVQIAQKHALKRFNPAKNLVKNVAQHYAIQAYLVKLEIKIKILILFLKQEDITLRGVACVHLHNFLRRENVANIGYKYK